MLNDVQKQIDFQQHVSCAVPSKCVPDSVKSHRTVDVQVLNVKLQLVCVWSFFFFFFWCKCDRISIAAGAAFH